MHLKSKEPPSSLKRVTSVEREDIFLTGPNGSPQGIRNNTHPNQIDSNGFSENNLGQNALFNNSQSNHFDNQHFETSNFKKKKTLNSGELGIDMFAFRDQSQTPANYPPKKTKIPSLGRLKIGSMASFSSPEYARDYALFDDKLGEEFFFKNERPDELPSNLTRLLKLKLAKRGVAQQYKLLLGERRRGLESEGNKEMVRELNGQIHDLSVGNNKKRVDIEKANNEMKHIKEEVISASRSLIVLLGKLNLRYNIPGRNDLCIIHMEILRLVWSRCLLIIILIHAFDSDIASHILL